MRIISGIHKGRRITAPKKLPVRPTTDMAKEALFNILNNTYYFDDLNVLDVFAGTGNISFEFASRGCTEITAVDAHYGCVKFISQTAKDFNFNITALKNDTFKYLEAIANTQQYDIIFADPPYDFDAIKFETIVELVFKGQLLTPNGCLIVEHSKHTDISKHNNFKYVKCYGGNCFSFFENTIM